MPRIEKDIYTEETSWIKTKDWLCLEDRASSISGAFKYQDEKFEGESYWIFYNERVPFFLYIYKKSPDGGGCK